jgi:hypothetical protein
VPCAMPVVWPCLLVSDLVQLWPAFLGTLPGDLRKATFEGPTACPSAGLWTPQRGC